MLPNMESSTNTGTQASTSNPMLPNMESGTNSGTHASNPMLPNMESSTNTEIQKKGGAIQNIHYGIKAVPSAKDDIKQVLPLIRGNSSNKELYDPRVISIGPYHSGKMELRAAQEMKYVLYEKYFRVDNFGNFYQRVKERVGYARSCYDEGSTDNYSDDDFTALMILDGFFVLALLQSYPSDEIGFNDLVVSTLGWNALGSLHNDVIVLVENQIPFPLLELIMKSIFPDQDKGMKILTTYLSSLLSWDIVGLPKGGGNYTREVKASDIIAWSPIHLAEVFWLCKYGLHQEAGHQKEPQEQKKKKLVATNVKDVLYSFASVIELKAMGIYVAPSTSLSPSAIAFKSYFFSGRLELPPCIYSDDDNREDANMMAYEFNSLKVDCFPATAYITLMKSLINHPDDVRELRSRKVLFATGISDERVVEIVKGKFTLGVNDYSVYNHIKERIHEHCSQKRKTWMAELNHDYFRNPWTFIAFVSATFLLAMGFTQTYFTVYPRK